MASGRENEALKTGVAVVLTSPLGSDKASCTRIQCRCIGRRLHRGFNAVGTAVVHRSARQPQKRDYRDREDRRHVGFGVGTEAGGMGADREKAGEEQMHYGAIPDQIAQSSAPSFDEVLLTTRAFKSIDLRNFPQFDAAEKQAHEQVVGHSLAEPDPR